MISIKDIKNNVKWFFQRRKRGFDDREIWDLHSTFTYYIRPRIKEFIRQEGDMPDGCPGSLTEDKEGNKLRSVEEGCKRWLEILKEIEEAFDLLYEHEVNWCEWVKLDIEEQKKRHQKINEGLKLFGEYYEALWN